jgi:pyridoxine 4-dehydrogenase
LRYYFAKYPEDADKVVLTMKGAYKHDTGPNGSAEGIQKSVEDALKVLDGTKTIDVFEMGR